MTEAEKIFVARMVPHMISGLNFEEAAKAVIEDDKRIYEECQKEEIKKVLCRTIFDACRK